MKRPPRLTLPAGAGATDPDETGFGEIFLDPDQARHGVLALRLKPGDVVEAAGPQGLAMARATSVSRRPLRLGLTLEKPWRGPSGPAGPRLALALIDFRRFDWAVEKAAELGAGELRPLICERIKPGLAQAAAARLERWRRLASAARKQCGRPAPLAVFPPLTFKALLSAGPGFFLSPEGLRPRELRPEELPPVGGQTAQLTAVPLIAVGPEGGFSPREAAELVAAGFRPWRLGPLTLRAETAALAALALLASGRPPDF